MSVDVVGKRVKSVCSFCGGDCERSERFDAYLCAKCNKWIERACADKACEFCVERPEVPFSSSSITIEIPGAPVPSMRKRAELIEEIERQLQTKTSIEPVFTLRWTLGDGAGTTA